jgi:hypothetical protein
MPHLSLVSLQRLFERGWTPAHHPTKTLVRNLYGRLFCIRNARLRSNGKGVLIIEPLEPPLPYKDT